MLKQQFVAVLLSHSMRSGQSHQSVVTICPCNQFDFSTNTDRSNFGINVRSKCKHNRFFTAWECQHSRTFRSSIQNTTRQMQMWVYRKLNPQCHSEIGQAVDHWKRIDCLIVQHRVALPLLTCSENAWWAYSGSAFSWHIIKSSSQALSHQSPPPQMHSPTPPI